MCVELEKYLTGVVEEVEKAPAPAEAPAPTYLVESIGRMTMVRVRGGTLAQIVPEVRARVLPMANQNVLLTLKNVADFTPEAIEELAALVKELQGGGRTLRVTNPDTETVEALRSAGHGDLAVERAS